jgi:hypothetical protein
VSNPFGLDRYQPPPLAAQRAQQHSTALPRNIDVDLDSMACRICKTPLNHFTMPGSGEITLIHAKSWVEYDHDPEPVPASAIPGRLNEVCDFCNAAEPAFLYYGENVVSVLLDNTHSYGKIWAGCAGCDRFVRRGDVEGLLQRLYDGFAARGAAGQQLREQFDDPEHGAEFRRHLHELQGRYVKTIHRREVIPPPPPPPGKLAASRLPQYRDRLIRYYHETAPALMYAATGAEPYVLPGFVLGDERFAVLIRSHDQLPDGQAAVERFCEHVAKGLSDAELFHVNREYTRLAVTSGKTLPDLTIKRDQLPAPRGLILFAEPVFCIPAQLDADVVAIGWVLVPDGVWINLYLQPEQVFGGRAQPVLRERLGFLIPASAGAGLAFGDNHLAGQEQISNPRQIWGTLLATFWLMRQKNVTEMQRETLPKKVTGAYARAGRRPPVVHLVSILKREPAGGAREGGKWAVRVLVGGRTMGFWKRVVLGPERSEREWRWMAPYAAGNPDAPLTLPKERVNVLR